jgi:hypothetical protein
MHAFVFFIPLSMSSHLHLSRALLPFIIGMDGER